MEMSERQLARKIRRYKKKILYILTHSRSGAKLIPHTELWDDVEKRLAQVYYDVLARDRDGCEAVPLERALCQLVAGIGIEHRLSLGLLTFLCRHGLSFCGLDNAIKALQNESDYKVQRAQINLEETEHVIRLYKSRVLQQSHDVPVSSGEAAEAIGKQ